jgi:hypothetical protein
MEHLAEYRGPWIAFAVAALAILTLAVFSITGLLSTASSANQQLVSVRQICQQWSGTAAPTFGNSSARSQCTSMVDWMGQQLSDGRMTAPMMWGSPTDMGTTCRQWMVSRSHVPMSGAAQASWCHHMVSWMEPRFGSWNRSIMNGMGR